MNDATRQLQAILAGSAASSSRFPPQSRYATTPVATLATADGRQVPYLRRRLVPQPDRFTLVREHVVQQGDRLDRIAAAQLGDPELYWRLCDANGALRPEDLTDDIGRRLRITLPEGPAGSADD